MKPGFVLVVAVLVLTAGCLTGGGEDATTVPGGGDGSEGDDGDGDGADGSSSDGADGSSSDGADGSSSDGADGSSGDGADGGSGDVAGEWEPFSFDKPARYEYEVFMEDEGTGTIVWDVESVSDDEYTVHMVYEMGDERLETTATGSKDTVMQQFFTNPGGVILMTTMYQPAAWYEGRDLSTGTKWSYATQHGSASFAITGTDTVAGVDCSTSEMRINGSVFHEACFSPTLGLAPYAAYYGEDGALEMAVTLVSYEEH